MSKVLDKMLERRVESALENLNRAGALLTEIKEGRRCVFAGATICELLTFARKHADELQTVLLRIDDERHKQRKAAKR